MSNPKNASISGEGFRFYRWDPAEGGEPTDVLSVTSIRRLCGEPYVLVRWQIGNVIDTILGTQKQTTIGPRGGVTEKRQVFEFPSEFAKKYDATAGEQGAIDSVRKWLSDTADEPRNIAAIRGTITHEAIEKNVDWTRIEQAYVESAFAGLSNRDKSKVKDGVRFEDVNFVRNSLRQYWDMRANVPMFIIAREVQVFNLTAGYAGSADALAWLLPDGYDGPMPKAETFTLDMFRALGGELALLDWKTSKGVYTDQVVQAHAYMAAEFVGTNGIIDHRLTELLNATMLGGLVHIRPNSWAVHLFDFNQSVLRAFLGSVAFARFLATYPEPDTLFTANYSGSAPEGE